MKVAVLGSSGAMGSYFAGYFMRLGHSVVGSDLRPGRSQTGIRFVRTNTEAVEGADLVLLAVSIPETLNVARGIARALKRGCTLVEITSVKGSRLHALEELAAENKVSLLSVHAMLGPSSKSKAPKILVVGTKKDLVAAGRVFPGARLILVTPHEHDRLMAYTLSLVHLTNLALVSAVEKGSGLAEFKRTAPPFASVQFDLARAVLSQDPALYSQIDTENQSAAAALTALIAELSSLRGLVARKDAKSLEGEFKRVVRRFADSELRASLARIYSVADG